jgi:hypothetical protein
MSTEEPTSQELLPYVKPAVERIPLSDARAGGAQFVKNFNDFNTSSS